MVQDRQFWVQSISFFSSDLPSDWKGANELQSTCRSWKSVSQQDIFPWMISKYWVQKYFYISSTRSWLFRQPRETILKFSCVKMTLVLTADPRRLMKGRFTAKVFYSLIYNLSSTLHNLRKHFIKDILNQSSVYLPNQKPV